MASGILTPTYGQELHQGLTTDSLGRWHADPPETLYGIMALLRRRDRERRQFLSEEFDVMARLWEQRKGPYSRAPIRPRAAGAWAAGVARTSS